MHRGTNNIQAASPFNLQLFRDSAIPILNSSEPILNKFSEHFFTLVSLGALEIRLKQCNIQVVQAAARFWIGSIELEAKRNGLKSGSH